MQYTAVATELRSSGTANMRSEYARRAGSVDQRLPFTLAALPLVPLELANGPVPVCFASETARAISIPPSFRGMVTTSAVLFAADDEGLGNARAVVSGVLDCVFAVHFVVVDNTRIVHGGIVRCHSGI